VRRDRNGHGHNGRSAAGHPPFSRSEPAPSAKHASDPPNSGPAATRPQDDPRLEALRLIAGRLKKLSWTPALFALLLDELYVDDLFTTVVGDPDAIPPRGYAHAVAVAIEEVEPPRGRRAGRVVAALVVETESQRRILIGSKGSVVRAIGAGARPEIEQLLGGTIYLDLSVKVRPRWRRDAGLLDRFGL